MTRTIVVDPLFEDVWPHAANYLREHWEQTGAVSFTRLPDERTTSLSEAVSNPQEVTKLIALGVKATPKDLEQFTSLKEAFVMTDSMYGIDEEIASVLEERGVTVHDHTDEGFWSESVSEFGLALTIDGLRRIPQKHAAMTKSHAPWDPEELDNEVPGANGHQFADPPEFVNGTLAGKRVRVAGIGNIGSRYAAAADFLGAEVTAYDPYADEPCFHLSGSARCHSLEELVADAEVFVPTVPLTDATRGLITSDLIHSLPTGCLVVLITRAGVCDMDAIRERVLAGEIALAADVWDEEPLPLDDSLLGHQNVVHTPHIAGRTDDANRRWAEMLIAHFSG